MRKEHRYLLKLWTDSENINKEAAEQQQHWRVSLFDIQFSNEPHENLSFKNIDAFCDYLKELLNQEQADNENRVDKNRVEKQKERV